MKKAIILSAIILNACAYKPIIDTAGRSGTFHESKAVEITNDIQHCEYQAKKHTNLLIESTKKGYNWLIRPKLLWLSPKATDQYQLITINCLEGRGHSVLNKNR